MFGCPAAFPSRGVFEAIGNMSGAIQIGVFNTMATFVSPSFKSRETNLAIPSRTKIEL